MRLTRNIGLFASSTKIRPVFDVCLEKSWQGSKGSSTIYRFVGVYRFARSHVKKHCIRGDLKRDSGKKSAVNSYVLVCG